MSVSIDVHWYGAHGRGKSKGGTDVSAAVAAQLIAKGLEAYGKETVEEVQKERLIAAGNIQKDAQDNVSVYLGTTRQSIRQEASGSDVIIRAGGAAKYLEYGTGRGGGPSRNKLIAWMEAKGITPFPGQSMKEAAFFIARHINIFGTRDHPFFFPAFERERQPFIDRVKALFR